MQAEGNKQAEQAEGNKEREQDVLNAEIDSCLVGVTIEAQEAGAPFKERKFVKEYARLLGVKKVRNHMSECKYML